jgi:hypothetical protein
VIAAFSKSNNCFFLKDDPPHDTRFGQVAGPSGSCNAASAGGVTWNPSW